VPDIRILLTTSISVAAVAGGAGFAVGRIQGGAAPQARSPVDPALAAADREMDALAAEVAKAEAAALADGAGALAPGFAAFGGAPGRTCLRSVEITSTGEGKPPRVVSGTWGDCGGVSRGTKAPSKPGSPTPTEL
jgi:hypothetical protein